MKIKKESTILGKDWTLTNIMSSFECSENTALLIQRTQEALKEPEKIYGKVYDPFHIGSLYPEYISKDLFTVISLSGINFTFIG